jgi:hypothetical protein
VGSLPLVEMVRASINTQPVGNGPAGSVDCTQGTRMDLIVPAPTTHPRSRVGHDILCLVCTRNEHKQPISVYKNNSAKITLFFSMQVKNNPHDEMQFVRLNLIRVRSRTLIVRELMGRVPNVVLIKCILDLGNPRGVGILGGRVHGPGEEKGS